MILIMLVKVTNKHLAEGGISAYDCPINLALWDCGCSDIAVHPSFATFSKDGIFQQIDFPQYVQNFICNWDNNLFDWPGETFEFEAEPFQVNRGE